MIIDAPFNIGIMDASTGGHELHLDFTVEFRQLKLSQQADEFKSYISSLVNEISGRDEFDADRQGMLTILQIAEQLLPHIEANEIPLDETIVISLQQDQDNPFGAIRLE